MSDSPAFDFGKFIPGFDFLQNLATSAKGPAGPVSRRVWPAWPR